MEKLPFITVGDVLGWEDLNFYPNIEQLENMDICIEYKPELESDLFNWIMRVYQLVIINEVDLVIIIVFADFDKLSSGKVAKLVNKFAKAHAMFCEFPKNASTFYEALCVHNHDAQNAKLQNAAYETERKKILEAN